MTRYSNPPHPAKLAEDFQQLIRAYTDLDETRQQATQALDALTAAGIYDSIPTASYEKRRENGSKALRLVFPTQHGERVREYIGTDPDARAAALAQIERTKQARALERFIDDIEGSMKRYADNIHRATTESSMAARFMEKKLEGLT